MTEAWRAFYAVSCASWSRPKEPNVTLWLDLTADDMRLLKRTAARQPAGGFVDLANAILRNARVRKDGSAWSELQGRRLVQRFIRQRETGSGGWQTYLRKIPAQLQADGRVLAQWPDIVHWAEEQPAPHRAQQLVLTFETVSATTCA
jgi:hypothetical protein